MKQALKVVGIVSSLLVAGAIFFGAIVNKSVTSSAVATRSQTLKPGQTGVIAETAVGVTNSEEITEFAKALSLKDREGALEMAAQGRAYSLDKGTSVRVLDEAQIGHLEVQKVRILDGELYTKALWVPAAVVRAGGADAKTNP